MPRILLNDDLSRSDNQRCLSVPPSRSSTSSDFAMQRFNQNSEVYKMIQENRESRAAPRQSNTFKMLQEVLEADERGLEPVFELIVLLSYTFYSLYICESYK